MFCFSAFIKKNLFALLLFILLAVSLLSKGDVGAAEKIWPRYLTALKTATRFDTYATGYALTKSTNYLAYEKAKARGTTIKSELQFLSTNASPAGRLYAALLLHRFNTKLGEKALERLASDNTPVIYQFGCLQEKTTVGNLASKLKGRNPKLSIERSQPGRNVEGSFLK